MSVEFRGIGGLGQIGNLRNSGKAESGKATSSAKESDQVNFSSVLQDVNKVNAGGDENTERAERVAELKQQVSEGSYEPNLNKVASNLLQFLMEEK